ncbi:MAG: carbon-nitrogen hydrolase family protein [Opitutaceae bacterium]|nr:carbon-nitrogen hydrolase family protein [Opitutaceae bacterium]
MSAPLFTRLLLCSSLLASLSAARTEFTVAALKVMPAAGDAAANYARFETYARQAAASGAHLIVTPECYLDGYMGSTKFRPGMNRETMLESHTETMDGPTLRKVAALARELKVHLLFGFSERRGGGLFNTTALFGPDGALIGRYSKSHPLPGELYDAGGELPVFETALGRMGVLICFDRQPPENARILALKGAQFIVVPAFGRVREPMDEDLMMQSRAHENGICIIYVSQHNAFVADPDGVITDQARSDTRDMLMFGRVVLDERIHDRNSYRVRHPELYRPLLESSPAVKSPPP